MVLKKVLRFLGTDIMTAYATDSNGDTLLYQINNDLGHYFAINRDTGDIKIAKVIDKEKLPVVSFVLYIV